MKIDFQKVLTEFSQLDKTGNVVILALVMSLSGLYCITLLLMRRVDKCDSQKVCGNAFKLNSNSGNNGIIICFCTKNR